MTAEIWSGERVAGWLRQAAGLEQQFAPVSAVLFDAAGLQLGESVLDVGCGTGSTTRTALLSVGPRGHVCGLDISADMLQAAARTPGGDAIEWIEGDPVTWQPERTWDVVVSRFGVMFFSDPRAAFTTLAASTNPGGRLAVAVWSRWNDSELFAVPLSAAAAVLPDAVLPPQDSGPFSFSDDGYVKRLLTSSGWDDVHITEHSLRLPFCGGLPVDEAAVAALDFGPTRTITQGISDDERARVLEGMASVLAAHVDESGQPALQALIRIVTARR